MPSACPPSSSIFSSPHTTALLIFLQIFFHSPPPCLHRHISTPPHTDPREGCAETPRADPPAAHTPADGLLFGNDRHGIKSTPCRSCCSAEVLPGEAGERAAAAAGWGSDPPPPLTRPSAHGVGMRRRWHSTTSTGPGKPRQPQVRVERWLLLTGALVPGDAEHRPQGPLLPRPQPPARCSANSKVRTGVRATPQEPASHLLKELVHEAVSVHADGDFIVVVAVLCLQGHREGRQQALPAKPAAPLRALLSGTVPSPLLARSQELGQTQPGRGMPRAPPHQSTADTARARDGHPSTAGTGHQRPRSTQLARGCSGELHELPAAAREQHGSASSSDGEHTGCRDGETRGVP